MRVSQSVLNFLCERVRATEHAPSGLFQILERRRGLAEIVERGGVVSEERPRVIRPHRNSLQRFAEAKALLRKTIPIARRVFGENREDTIRLRWIYAEALYRDSGATLDDVHEAVNTLEDAERITRRVMGGASPLTVDIERDLRKARAALRARETPSGSA